MASLVTTGVGLAIQGASTAGSALGGLVTTQVPAAGAGIAGSGVPAGATTTQLSTGFLLAASAAAGGTQAALSLQAAERRNEAIEDAQQASVEAAERRAASERAVALARTRSIVRARRQAEGRAQVLASALGLSGDRSVVGRLNQIGINAGLQIRNVEQDLAVRIGNTFATRDAQIQSLQNQTISGVASAFSAGVGGAQTGLGVLSTGMAINNALAERGAGAAGKVSAPPSASAGDFPDLRIGPLETEQLDIDLFRTRGTRLA
jgi:hypothetical protein